MENYHILKVTYLGPTNFKGSRVKIYSERFQQSKIIPYDYSFAHTFDITENWLNKNNFELIGRAEGKDCYYIISNTFEKLKSIQ